MLILVLIQISNMSRSPTHLLTLRDLLLAHRVQ